MFKRRNNSNEVPFNSLEETGHKGKYFIAKELAQDPDLIIKEARTKWGFLEPKGVHPLNDLGRAKEDLSIIKDNLSDFIPETNLVIGKNKKGEEVVYIVQHKIEGMEFKDADYNEGIAKQLEIFFDKVIEIYKTHLFFSRNSNQPRSIFPDIKGWNFIIGRDSKTKEQEPRLYFVDTYPVEGSDFGSFINEYLPRIVRPTFPGAYAFLIDRFRLKAYNIISEYVKDHSLEILRQN